MNCFLTGVPDQPIDPVDNGDVNERDFNQAITDKVSEYVASDDDLNDAWINSDWALRMLRTMYRCHAEKLDNDVFITHARTACMHIDSYLINRAVKELG